MSSAFCARLARQREISSKKSGDFSSAPADIDDSVNRCVYQFVLFGGGDISFCDDDGCSQAMKVIIELSRLKAGCELSNIKVHLTRNARQLGPLNEMSRNIIISQYKNKGGGMRTPWRANSIVDGKLPDREPYS